MHIIKVAVFPFVLIKKLGNGGTSSVLWTRRRDVVLFGEKVHRDGKREKSVGYNCLIDNKLNMEEQTKLFYSRKSTVEYMHRQTRELIFFSTLSMSILTFLWGEVLL